MRNPINNNTTLTLHPYIRTGDVYREHENSCNFTIKDFIGQGGSSIVYSAEDMFGNEVLLKEYFPNDLFVERCVPRRRTQSFSGVILLAFWATLSF